MKQTLKERIHEILTHPPHYEEMIRDLKMNNVVVRRRGGNIELFKTVNKNLLERVWKSYKMNSLIDDNAFALEEIGIDGEALQKAVRYSLNDLGEEVNKNLQSPIDGFADEGFLEIEVFKLEHKLKN